jgi:hypothetical protein
LKQIVDAKPNDSEAFYNYAISLAAHDPAGWTRDAPALVERFQDSEYAPRALSELGSRAASVPPENRVFRAAKPHVSGRALHQVDRGRGDAGKRRAGAGNDRGRARRRGARASGSHGEPGECPRRRRDLAEFRRRVLDADDDRTLGLEIEALLQAAGREK